MASESCPSCGSSLWESDDQCQSCGTKVEGKASETVSSNYTRSYISKAIGMFALAGLGLGLTGFVILTQFGGEGGSGMFSAIFSIIVLMMAMFLGPVLAIVVSTQLADHPGLTSLTCFLGNAIGYIVMMFVIALFLSVGIDMAVNSGGGGTITSSREGASVSKHFTTIAMLAIPTGLTGVGATIWSSFRP